MNLSITINTDNAAFDNDESTEVVRILRHLANTIESAGGLRDVNGNTVGHMDYSE